MTWIKTVDYDESEGKLRTLYDRVKGPDNNVDNIMMAHSLRPHTMEGHMVIYKNVLHHSSNQVPKHLLETLGVYVSMLNGCEYCVLHHFNGLKRLIEDDARAQAIWDAFKNETFESAFDAKERALLQYAKKLTQTPQRMEESDVQSLRKVGLDDGEILEINQVVSYFSYANRTVLGLGINTDGDILGLSPGDMDDADNWSHQ